MRKLVLFAVLAMLANVATVAALPRLINGYVMHRLVERSGGWNRAVAWPRATADSRIIVRPSPDLLYTSCAFDVSGGPLRIVSPVPDSYASISGFAANTDNFFAVNDADVAPAAGGSRQIVVIVARSEIAVTEPGARVVVAPSDRGLILFRTLIPTDGELPRLQQLQSQQRCEPLPRESGSS